MTDSHDRVRVRIAPSPTGPPHVGTAYIALFNYVFARHTGGDFVLRIEDTDRERSTQESEQQIIEALEWLGLDWDEGPDKGGTYGPYRQSERSGFYREYAEKLVKAGTAYYCFCSPERLARVREEQKKDGKGFIGYDGHCRRLSRAEIEKKLEDGEAYTIRLKVPNDGETRFEDRFRGELSFRNEEIDDQVLLKSDGFPTYHLANVVDDHLMEISHVIRAEEWISSTPKHVLLYQAFGWDLPVFVHMPLLRNKDQSKISKRKNPVSLNWYREQGFLPEALLNFLARMGWSFGDDREIFSIQEMIDEFSWDRTKVSGPVFDLEKLEWMNGEYIRAMSHESLLEAILAGPYTVHTDEPAGMLLEIVKLIQERINKLSEFDQATAFFFEFEEYDLQDLIPRKRDAAFTLEVIKACEKAYEGLGEWNAESTEQCARDICGSHDEWKGGDVFMPLRVAITCRKVSTPLFETMEILGRDECLRRLKIARDRLAGQI
jgi:glutamyl-tRNA synthetase